jgi:hypothetical protein
LLKALAMASLIGAAALVSLAPAQAAGDADAEKS